MATFSFEEAVGPQDVQQPERVAKTFSFEEVAPQGAPEEKASNPLYGAFGRAAELLGSGAEAVQRVSAPAAEGIQQALPESMRSKYLAPESIKERQQAFTEEATKYSKDIGYAPSTSLKDLGDNPLKVIPFVAERVITSAPDMAGAALAFTPYVMTRTNEILNERLKNDNKTYEQATVGDVAAATTAAIAESTLERFATKRILPGGKGIAGAPVAGGAAKRIGKEVGLQSGTESAEELASYLGEAAGTEKGFDPEEAGTRMLEAGIVGGGLGGAARGGREAYDAAKRKEFSFEEAKAEAQVVEPEAPVKPMTKGERKDLEQEQDRARAQRVTGKEPWEEIADEFLKKPPVEEKPAEAELVKPPLEPISKPIDIPSNKGKIEGVDEIDLDPAELKLSKDVPQFKEDANEEGVVEPLQGKKYEYIGTPPIQVWRRLDGSLEVISGRHRLDLAKRTGADRIPAQVFDEAKGFNADMAAIMDAELNIRDGKGKVTDYVNYFREAGNRFGLTEKDYKDRGLLDSSKGKRAYSITVQGSDDLIQSLRGRQVTEDTAYRIADAVPNDPRLQALGLKLVNEKPLEQAISILKAAKTIEPKQTEGGGEFDLFGFDASAMKLAEDMGKLALKKQRELSDDILAIKPAAKRADKAAKGGVKVANPEKVLAEAKRLEELRSRWDNWASDPELVDQIRRELAGEPAAEEKAAAGQTVTFKYTDDSGNVAEATGTIEERRGMKIIRWQEGWGTSENGKQYPIMKMIALENAKDVKTVAAEAKPKKPAKKVAEKKEKVEEKPVEQDKLTKWFGSSKVVDDNGKPMRMYHITTGDFKEFFPGGKEAKAGHLEGLSGTAMWFSPYKEHQAAMHNVAAKEGFKEGTNVMPVYLKIEKPLVIDDKETLEWAQNVFAGGSKDFPQIILTKWKNEVTKGGEYDGIIFKGEDIGWGKNSDEYIVFKPDQIKSAIGSGYTEGVGDITASFRLEPEQKQTAAEKKAAAEREQKEIADREAEFFKLTPRTPEQGAGNYLQQDMIGAMGLTEAEFKKGIDKKSTEPGEPLILRNVTMEEHDTYNDDANQKVDQETIDLYGNMDDVKGIDVDEKNIEHTLSRQAKAVEEYVTMASQGKVTAEEFMKTVRAAAAKGDVSQDVLDSIEYMYKNFPSVLDGIRFEVVSGSKKTGAYREAGHYQPLARMIRLFKDTSGVMTPATVRHEIAHTMEQMMTPEQKRMVVRAWKDALIRATRAETTDEGHVFFQNVSKFLHDPKLGTLKAAIKSMPNVSYYQYINPSEYWAVNAEEILKSRTEGASSLRQSMEKLSQGLKQSFGMSNFWVGNRVFDQILNGDRFSNKMLLNYLSQTKMRNYLGEKAPLATWDSMGTNWLENKKYEYVDKYIDLLRAKQDIERMVGDVEEDVDAYTKETLSHSRISTKIKDFMRDHVAKLADVMRSNNISQQQLHEYLWARHAMDYNRVVGARNPEMGDNAAGISTDDAQNYIKSLGEARKAQLDKAAKEIDLMTQSTRNILLDSGYEKFDTLNAWQTMFPSYVPLYRKDLEYAGGKLGVGKGFSVQGKFSKAAMGSTKEVADISESVIRDHIRAIEKAERARVTRALYGMAIKHPNPSFWMAIDPRAVANPAETRKKLENIGVDPELIKNLMQPPKQGVINPETGLVEYRPSKVVLQSDNVVATRIDGEDVYVVFNNSDPRAARLAMAMKNMDLPDVEGFYRASAYVTRFFAMVNTQLNPIFGLWNFARDVQGAALNLSTTKLKGMEKEILKDSFSSVKDIYRAIRQERTTGERATTPGADIWYEFQSVGGTTGYKAQMVSPKSDVKVLEQAVKELNRGKPAKVVKWVGNWISDYNDTLENAVRLSSYKAALKKGMSQQEAANIAKNLTVNFNRKGAKSQVAGALFAFFNASVQGTSRLYQTLKGPLGKKIMFGGFLLGVAQSAMMALAGLEDDEPPDFVKEKNIIIPFGMFPGSDSKKYISFPMPLGYNVFPGIGRIFGEAVIGAAQGKDVSKKFFDVLSLLANSFNPLGSSGLAWQTIMPTPLDPFMALAQNKDAFGRPIYKQDRETNPQVGYERTRDSTAALWKGMAEFINYMTGGTADVKGVWSPTGDEIAYLAGQAGGGIAREVGKIYGTASDFITGDETPSYKIPLIGKLYGDAESKAAVKNRFYANVTKLAEVERTVKGMQKRGDNVMQYRRENPESQLINVANRIENEITQLNKTRSKMIERGATMEQIKRIEDVKERKMRMLNERYTALRKL